VLQSGLSLAPKDAVVGQDYPLLRWSFEDRIVEAWLRWPVNRQNRTPAERGKEITPWAEPCGRGIRKEYMLDDSRNYL
jgi:hypothetical protein